MANILWAGISYKERQRSRGIELAKNGGELREKGGKSFMELIHQSGTVLHHISTKASELPEVIEHRVRERKRFMVFQGEEEVSQSNPIASGSLDADEEVKPDPPQVDFSKYMLIAAFMGERKTTGYSIEIYDIFYCEFQGKDITVGVKKYEPGSHSIVGQAIVRPYHVVKVEKSDKEVGFQKVKVRSEIKEIIYRSHYNPELAVILSEDGLYGSRAKYLSVKLQIPTKEVELPEIRIEAIGDMDIATLKIDEAKKLGWDAWVCGSGTPRDAYCLEKGDILISMFNYPKDRFPPEQTEMMATKYHAASLTEQEKEEMTNALVAIGFATNGESFWENATKSVVDVPDLAPAIEIDAKEFDWDEAMRTELT